MEDIANGFRGFNPGQDPGSDQLWYGLQNALGAVANISKVLWGQQLKDGSWPKEVERKPLRDFLGIAEPSVLKSKNMRNNLEHFDERIDKWFNWAMQHFPIPSRTYRAVATLDPGRDDKGLMLWFNVRTLTLFFWDHEPYDLYPVGQEVERITAILEDEFASGWFS